MIDVNFDFTSDTPHYWDGFWERNGGLGLGATDPDKHSPTLKSYHQQLWSKELPNGEKMNLQPGDQYTYLQWKNFRLSSDTIIISLIHWNNKSMVDQINARLGDYKPFYLDLIHKAYTIGGMIIFPQHQGSINQGKGCNKKISDRWDLTLECIRRYYKGEDSPLYKTLARDKEFFHLFVDFKGYVDYFFLQDCVSDDYSSVDIWCGDDSFEGSGLPKTLDEYFAFIENQLEFLKRRSQRIHEYCMERKVLETEVTENDRT